MANVGSLTIQMAADLAKLQSDMGKATQIVEKFASNAKKILGVIGVGISLNYLKNLANTALDAGDKLADLTVKTGLSVEMLQDLELAAKMTDIPLEKMTMTMTKLQIAVSDALAGQGKAMGVLSKMGIDPKSLKDADQLLGAVLDKISKMNDTGALADAAKLVGGKQASSLVLLADAYTRARDIMKSFGLALDGLDTAKLSEASDIMKALGHYTDLATRQIMVGMTPALVGIINWLMKLGEGGENAKDKWQSFGKVIGDVMITAIQWTIKAIAEVKILINELESIGRRTSIKSFMGVSYLSIAEENEWERNERQAQNERLRKRAKIEADSIRIAEGSIIPTKKSRKLGAAGLDESSLKKLQDEEEKRLKRIGDAVLESQKVINDIKKEELDIIIKKIELTKQMDSVLSEQAIIEAEIYNIGKLDKEQLSIEQIRYENSKKQLELDKESINQKLYSTLTQQTERDQLISMLKLLEQKGVLLDKNFDKYQKERDLQLKLKYDAITGMQSGLSKLQEEYESQGRQMESFTISTFKTMEDAILDFTSGTEFSFKNMVISINRELQRILLQQLLFAPLAKSLGQFTSSYGGGGLLSGFGGMLSTIGGGGNWQSAWDIFSLGGNDAVLGMLAKGGVINRGNLQKFAGGGIFHTPKLFPMANGNIGMLGEAGPEAVMPLTRGPDGKLGVSSSNNSQPVNINIYANDAKSFDEMVRRNPESITSIISKALKGNGQLRHDIRNTR